MKYWLSILVGVAVVVILNMNSAHAYGTLICQNSRTLDIQAFPGRFYCPQGWVRIYQ